MRCPECGAENAENTTVCIECGKLLKTEKHSYGRDFAWASLVLGIASMLIFPYLYGTLAVLAALFARKQSYNGKMATVGLILGFIAVVGWVVTQIISVII